MGADETFELDPTAVRALADGLGTAGQEIQVIGRGGALADGVLEGFPGADTPSACKTAERSADQALAAVGTALMELGGSAVAAIIALKQQDGSTAHGIAMAEEGVR
ncbi:hypothetical protein [Nocardia sp. CA-120079]|uniref:hypothetical protein n=1 Tax=Nocardia sp. CA-120079 TaxID=3239974 RepID=UPI003D9634C4